jgi:membrane-associated protein
MDALTIATLPTFTDLSTWVATLGPALLPILFIYGFSQTGLIVGPLVPGNPFLVAIGAWASASGAWASALVAVGAGAAVGTWANYAQGRWLAERWAGLRSSPRLAGAWERTEAFYGRSGALASFAANFLPVARALSPFVAGATGFAWRRFALVAPLGAAVWTSVGLTAGSYLGRFAWVQENLSALTLGLVALLIAAPAVRAFLSRTRSRTTP